jgi:subtilisin family serine protease
MKPRRLLAWTAAFAMLLGGGASSWAVVGANKAGKQPLRILVKLKPSLAAQVEAELATADLQVVVSTAATPAESFLKKHRIKKMRPLHGDLVRDKKKKRKSFRALAEEIKQQFPQRSRRFTRSFNPPDLSTTYLIEGFQSQSELKKTVDSLKGDASVDYAEQEQYASIQMTPNDPFWSSKGSWAQAEDDLWGLKIIQADKAWDTKGGEGVVVAVVDTGVDYTHPDIAANMWTDGASHFGHDFVANDNATSPTEDLDPMDTNGHGTHVSGTIAAIGNNSLGVIGVAYKSKIMAVRVLASDGSGGDGSIAQGIRWAADHGAQVINLSLGGPADVPATHDAIIYAHQLGVVIVVAAGNDGVRLDDSPEYPAAYPEVITVSAFDWNDRLAYFSNFGTKIDVGAPGYDVLSLKASQCSLCSGHADAIVQSSYLHLSGTSMATPHVAGVAALILSQHPTYSNEQVRQALRQSGDHVSGTAGFSENSGYGRVSAARALNPGSAIMDVITAPVMGDTVSSQLSIVGTAAGSGFSSYRLEYSTGGTFMIWNMLTQSQQPVTQGVLGALDVSTLPQNPYWLRLTVYDTSGLSYKFQTYFFLKFSEITSPAAPPSGQPFLAKMMGTSVPLTISGTAAGQGFQNYTVSWARGLSPSSGWSPSGVALARGGFQQVSSSTLATMDLKSITVADYYTFRLDINFGTRTVEQQTVVYVDPDLADGWPQLGSGYGNSASLFPVNPSGGSDLLNIGFDIYRFSPNGRVNRFGLSVYPSPVRPVFTTFGAMGKVAVLSSRNNVELLAVKETGSSTPIILPESVNIVGLSAADLDGDGVAELLVAANLAGFGTQVRAGRIYIYKVNGQQFSLQNVIYTDSIQANMNSVLTGTVNGQINIFAFTSTHLKRFDVHGALLGDLGPDITGKSVNIVGGAVATMKGTPAIVFGISDFQSVTLHTLSLDGAELSGWPIQNNTSFANDLIVGDLNADGNDEVVVLGQNISIYNFQGKALAGWPLSGSYSEPRIVDIDGDGIPELIAGTCSANGKECSVQSFHSNGSLYKTWRITEGLDDGSHTNPNWPFQIADILIGDFHGDGKTDLAVQWFVNNGITTPAYALLGIYRLNTSYNPARAPWPMRFHDAEDSASTFSSGGSVAPPPTSGFVVAKTLGTLRNTWTGWVGMQFTVGSQPLSINALGRIAVAGNTVSHQVKIVSAQTGLDMPGASATIAPGGTPGQFNYSSLSSPVTLSANTAYHIESREENGGDFWYDDDTVVTSTSVATIDHGEAAFGDSGAWFPHSTANHSYVPVDFQYTLVPPLTVLVASKVLGTLRNNWAGWVGAQFTVGSQPLSIASLGRIMVAGNTNPHQVKIVNAQTGLDLPGASVTVYPIGIPGQFSYAFLSSPVTLSANTAYYIESRETDGGDFWYDDDTVVTPTSVATIDHGEAAFGDSGAWFPHSTANHGYVPVDFQYILSAVPDATPPSVAIASPQNGATVSGVVSLSATATDNIGVTKLEFYAANALIATLSSAPYVFNWDTTQFSAPTGPVVLTAKGYDAAGNTASASVNILIDNAGSGISNSPAVWYHLDESGGALMDSSGHSYNASAHNGVTYGITGKWNTAVHFDGVEAYADAPQAPHFTSALTAMAWVKADDVNQAQAFVSQGRDYYGSGWGFMLVGGAVIFSVNTDNADNTNEIVLRAPFTDTGNWHHVAGSYDGKTANLYVDGELKASGTSNGPIVYRDNESLTLGRLGWGDYFKYKGALDEVMLFDAALTPGEVQTQMALSAGVVVSSAATFIKQVTPGTLRNNFSGFVGLKFTVGSNPLSVRAIGRLRAPGNTSSHMMKISRAGDGVEMAQVTVPSGASTNQFNYATLPSPITLDANTVYFIGSNETAGADQWYDYDTVVIPGVVGTVDSPAAVFGNNWYVLSNGIPGNHSYVPVDFTFTVLSSTGSTNGAVAVGAAPTAPTLNVVGSIPANGTLTAALPGDTASVFKWVFLPNGSMDQAISLSSGEGALPLNTLHLKGGRYTVLVFAVDAQGRMSPSVSADIQLVSLTSESLVNPRVYPNPWRVDREPKEEIIFDQMNPNSTVKIFTLSGRWVKTLSAPAGKAVWGLTTDSGDKVASGLYFYLITNSQGGRIRGKLGIIR